MNEKTDYLDIAKARLKDAQDDPSDPPDYTQLGILAVMIALVERIDHLTEGYALRIYTTDFPHFDFDSHGKKV